MALLMSSIIGHRGCAGYVPENTLAGFREAALRGCRWVEADATLLADGALILFHDERLERTTNGTGLVVEQNYDQIVQLDAGRWFGDPSYFGEKVASLKQALLCCQELGLGFNIELKVHNDESVALARAVSKLVASVDYNKLVISSFDLLALEAYDGVAPKAILYEELPDHWEADAVRLQAKAINLGKDKICQTDVDQVKASGRELYVYTVDKPEDLNVQGVDGVFTNYP